MRGPVSECINETIEMSLISATTPTGLHWSVRGFGVILNNTVFGS